MNNETINHCDLAITTVVGGIGGAISGDGIDGKRKIGSYKQARRVIKATSSRNKINFYKGKQKRIIKDVVKAIRKTALGVVVSNTLSKIRRFLTGSRY